MPERLDPNVIDTITIALSDLPGELFSQLDEMFALTFDKSEYLLLQAKELLQEDEQDAANRLVKMIDEGLQHGELARVLPLRVNLAFYAVLNDAAAGRIDQLRGVASRIGGKLGVLNAYACVIKQDMRGEENALAMDRCLEAAKADADRLQIPVLLVNRGLGITLDLPLKATVRYLHIISRNSRLKAQLLNKTELITSIAMLEYDDEDAFSLQEQIDKLQGELTTGAFSKSRLNTSVQALVSEASQRLEQKDRIAFSQWPLRADAIGNLFTILFGRAKLRRALNDVEKTFAAVYQDNIHARYCDGCFQTEESLEALSNLLESCPIGYLREQLTRDLEELAGRDTQTYIAHVPRLRICLGEKKLRAQLEEEYQKSLQRSRNYLQHVVLQELLRQVGLYRSGERIKQREQDLKERILRLKAKARAVGNAQSAVDFLQTQLTFLPIQGGVPFENLMNKDMILLISRRTYDEWDQYEQFLPGAPHFDVYNYGVLEDQELQALQIMRFNAELYQTNRRQIFQIG